MVAREEFHSGWPVRRRARAETPTVKSKQNKQLDAPALPLFAVTRQPIRFQRRPLSDAGKPPDVALDVPSRWPSGGERRKLPGSEGLASSLWEGVHRKKEGTRFF